MEKGSSVLWGDGYLRVGRQERGAEQLVGLLPVGLQHGLQPLQQLRPLLLQLLAATLQVTHASLLPCQSEEERGQGDAQLATCLLPELGPTEGSEGGAHMKPGAERSPKVPGAPWSAKSVSLSSVSQKNKVEETYDMALWCTHRPQEHIHSPPIHTH